MKVAALDFDGTLHHPPQGFREEDIAAIDAWRNAGHLVISATGRSRSALAYAMTDSALRFDYRVLSNGGSATTGDGTELIYGYDIDGDILRAVLSQFGTREGLAIFGTTLGRIDGTFANTTGSDHPFTAHFTPMTDADIDHHRFAVIPVWVPDDEDLRAEVVAWAEGLGSVSVAQNQDYVDIMAPGRTKGSGIAELLSTVGFNRTDIELITFGDSWNDLSMHDIADVSYSFPHSPLEVQQATDHVVATVAEGLRRHM